MVGRQRSWGVIAFAVMAVGIGGFAASAGGSTALAGSEAPPTSSTTTSTTTTSTTTSTTTTTTLPLVATVDATVLRQEPATHVTAMPTLPPPPTTTLPPDPCASDTLLAHSGSGRRVVYSKQCQRVWLIGEDGTIVKSHAVSGRRTWNQPTPNNLANDFEPAFRHYNTVSGAPPFYRVASRSAHTCNINKPYLCWRYMVRFTKGPEGDNIGFHEIPVDTRTGRRVQNESQLGAALSNGCVRQATPDAQYMWDWAWNNTKVVVLP